MSKPVFFIPAHIINTAGFCERKGHLQLKYGLRGPRSVNMVAGAIRHDFFCKYKEDELLLAQQGQQDIQQIKKILISDTLNTLDAIVEYHAKDIFEAIDSELQGNRENLLTKLRMESSPSEREAEVLTKVYIDKLRQELQQRLEALIELRAPHVAQLVSQEIKFARKENPYSSNTIHLYDKFQNKDEGLEAKPDFLVLTKKPEHWELAVLYVKPKLSRDSGGKPYTSDLLQFGTGVLALEPHKGYLEGIAEGSVVLSQTIQVFEYERGTESDFPVDIQKVRDLAKRLRAGNFPTTEFFNRNPAKCDACDLKTVCSKYN